MAFNLTAKIGADGSGYFREMAKVKASAEKLQTDGARAQASAVLADKQRVVIAERLARFKAGETALATRAEGTSGDAERFGRINALRLKSQIAVEREIKEQKTLADEAARTAAKRIKAEEAVARVRERMAKERATIGEGPLKSEAGLVTAEARAQVARDVEAKARAASDKNLAARAARLQQLQARAASLATAEASAKVGSEAHGRTVNALNRVREKARELQTEYDRLGRSATASGAQATRAFNAAAEAKRRATLAGGLKVGAPTAPGRAPGTVFGMPTAGMGASALAGFGAPLGAAAAVGATVAAVRGALQFADQIKDTAEMMNLTTGEVQKLEIAAGRAGISMGDFQMALSQVDVKRREAAEGNEETLATFRKFGVTLADLQNPQLRHIDLLRKITANTKDATAAERVMMKDLLGKRGDRLGSALAEVGKVGENEIVSDASLARLDEMNKRVEDLGRSWKNNVVTSIAAADEAMQFFFDGFFRNRGLLEKNKVEPMSREKRAERGMMLDRNAGIEDADFTGETALLRDFYLKRAAMRAEADSKGGKEGLALGKKAEAMTFDQFAKDRGAVADKELFTNQERLKLEESIAEIVKKRADIGLTTAEKEAKLKREIADMEELMQGADEKEIETLLFKKSLEEKNNELAQLQAKPNEKGTFDRPDVDALTRIGLFHGTGPVGVAKAPLTADEQRGITREMINAANANARAQLTATNQLRGAVNQTF